MGNLLNFNYESISLNEVSKKTCYDVCSSIELEKNKIYHQKKKEKIENKRRSKGETYHALFRFESYICMCGNG